MGVEADRQTGNQQQQPVGPSASVHDHQSSRSVYPIQPSQRHPMTKPRKKKKKKQASTVRRSSGVENLPGKVGQHEARAVDVGVVVAAQTLLLVARPRAQRLAHVAGGVLAAHHEADLAGRVGGDGGVGVVDDGEHGLAGLLQVADQREVQPLVFG